MTWQASLVTYLRDPRTWDSLRRWAKAKGVRFALVQAWVNTRADEGKVQIVRSQWTLHLQYTARVYRLPAVAVTPRPWVQMRLL